MTQVSIDRVGVPRVTASLGEAPVVDVAVAAIHPRRGVPTPVESPVIVNGSVTATPPVSAAVSLAVGDWADQGITTDRAYQLVTVYAAAAMGVSGANRPVIFDVGYGPNAGAVTMVVQGINGGASVLGDVLYAGPCPIPSGQKVWMRCTALATSATFQPRLFLSTSNDKGLKAPVPFGLLPASAKGTNLPIDGSEVALGVAGVDLWGINVSTGQGNDTTLTSVMLWWQVAVGPARRIIAEGSRIDSTTEMIYNTGPPIYEGLILAGETIYAKRTAHSDGFDIVVHGMPV